ncbi:hypothetical protein ATANTOWER_031721 [Ataeniobius toweri]|uniref:Uncharacterized protein n=1 Tax=Ataeniobius toweri TaxID=208326 RepID=A0ABU7AHJ9_9TELE|nr:hypothetical protein [Ataeniobius toweri]
MEYFVGTLWTPLVPTEHHTVADHVHFFMSIGTHLLMGTSRIMLHATKIKPFQPSFVDMIISSLSSNGLHSHQISVNRAALGCSETGDSLRRSSANTYITITV